MTTYHLLNSHLRLLHPFPFPSRQAAEEFRDKLGSQDEIVTQEVKMLGEDETNEIDENLAVERTMETVEASYLERNYDETR